jgi:hypothetical protein
MVCVIKYKYLQVVRVYLWAGLEMGRYIPVHHTETSFSSRISYRHLSLYIITIYLLYFIWRNILVSPLKRYTGSFAFPFRALFMRIWIHYFRDHMPWQVLVTLLWPTKLKLVSVNSKCIGNCVYHLLQHSVSQYSASVFFGLLHGTA